MKYLVLFDELGYYSEKQPNYDWSFSENRIDALKYKTLNGAMKRISQAFYCSYKNKFTNAFIETVEYRNDNIVVVNKTTWTKEMFQELEDKINEKKAEKERNRLKAPEYQSNVTVIVDDDSIFWNVAYGERLEKRESMKKKMDKVKNYE